MTIRCVWFEHTVPVSLQLRADKFDVDDGFAIDELEPGRVRVWHPLSGAQIHQDVPYTLFVSASEPAVEAASPLPPASAVGSGIVKKRR